MVRIHDSLTIKAFLVSLLLNSVTAAPTLVDKQLADSVMALDADIHDIVSFNVPSNDNSEHSITFDIDKTIAEKSAVLARLDSVLPFETDKEACSMVTVSPKSTNTNRREFYTRVRSLSLPRPSTQ